MTLYVPEVMPHGNQDQCDKWHELDRELFTKLQQPIDDLQKALELLKDKQSTTEALECMCAIARQELLSRATKLEACEDVLEYCVRGITDLRRCIQFALCSIDSCRRFAAGAVLAHHDSIMPHLSSEELATINQFDSFNRLQSS